MKTGVIIIIAFFSLLLAWPKIESTVRMQKQLDKIRFERVRNERNRYRNTERNISKASCSDLQFAYNRCIDGALLFEGKCRQVFMSALNKKCIDNKELK